VPWCLDRPIIAQADTHYLDLEKIMTTWKLSPQYKKSAVEKMFFRKDDKCIVMEQGFRWATFSVESDDRPLTDEELVNTDVYELGCIENDECWEMEEMMDGCWLDIDSGNDNTTDEDVEAFTEAWEEDSFEAVEAAGWSNDDTEYYYYGPLELTNEDTGEVFQGEPVEPQEKDRTELAAELDELIAAMPEVTNWFPSDVEPAYQGRYQVLTKGDPAWPFPQYAEWNGNEWNLDVSKWRGLANDPT
jgi:hypothetical protein